MNWEIIHRLTGKGIGGILIAAAALGLAGCISSDVRKGTMSLTVGDYDRAIIFFSRALERNPAHFEARLGMGKALLQRAVDAADDSVSWRLALMNMEAARTIGGGRDIDRLLSQTWLERAYGLLRRADTLPAIEALTKAIAFDPQSSEPLNLAGIVYFRMGKTEKARMLFERAVRADTLAASPLFNLGMVHWEQNQPRLAYERWLAALKKAPEDETVLQWFATAEKRLRQMDQAAGKGRP
jgi:tetratricopeptide (TPR) repeat protein